MKISIGYIRGLGDAWNDFYMILVSSQDAASHRMQHWPGASPRRDRVHRPLCNRYNLIQLAVMLAHYI
jgi:hypothetical protein